MTFAAVGGNLSSAAGATTFSLTPAGVGNLILFEVENPSATVWATALSSSNVTWSVMGVKFSGTTNARSSTLFQGKVTATSAQTVTITFNGTAGNCHGVGHEFSSTAGAWALDVQGNLDSAGTATWPSLTPAGSGELYFGYSINSSGAVAGSTSGYTYVANADGAANGMAYNPACGAGATGPVWGDSTEIFGIMALVKETSAAAVPYLRNYPAKARLPGQQGLQLSRPGLIYANSVQQVP